MSVAKNGEGVWTEILHEIPQCKQRQDGLLDQLFDLRRFANKLGFYDAADYLRNVCETNGRNC